MPDQAEAEIRFGKLVAAGQSRDQLTGSGPLGDADQAAVEHGTLQRHGPALQVGVLQRAGAGLHDRLPLLAVGEGEDLDRTAPGRVGGPQRPSGEHLARLLRVGRIDRSRTGGRRAEDLRGVRLVAGHLEGNGHVRR